jgi:DNA repair exonuclease SbcCD ATPase subunit
MDIEMLRDWAGDARRFLGNEADRLREKEQQLGGLMRCLEATGELLSEVGHLQEELEQKQQEVDDLYRDLETSRSEADRLRLQLAEAKEQRLAESQSAAQERLPHLTEIHNHFEPGSSAQVGLLASTFLGPSACQLMITPVSVSPVANFRCG